jgi:hypothetical protein
MGTLNLLIFKIKKFAGKNLVGMFTENMSVKIGIIYFNYPYKESENKELSGVFLSEFFKFCLASLYLEENG